MGVARAAAARIELSLRRGWARRRSLDDEKLMRGRERFVGGGVFVLFGSKRGVLTPFEVRVRVLATSSLCFRRPECERWVLMPSHYGYTRRGVFRGVFGQRRRVDYFVHIGIATLYDKFFYSFAIGRPRRSCLSVAPSLVSGIVCPKTHPCDVSVKSEGKRFERMRVNEAINISINRTRL